MKTNMVCICLYMDMSYLVNDDQATIYRTTEVRDRVRDLWGEQLALSRKGNRIDGMDGWWLLEREIKRLGGRKKVRWKEYKERQYI